MSSSTVAARAARLAILAAVVATGANLVACGTEGGRSSHLPAGQPTTAPPGDLVLYAAMSMAGRIDAFRLGTDGLLPSKPFSTMFVTNPRRIVVSEDGVLYATLHDRIISAKLGADGSLPDEPTSETRSIEQYDPVDLELGDGILYVASAGAERMESFELEADGSLPFNPTGAGVGEYEAEYSTIERNGRYLYAGARDTQFVDLFILKDDGNVPLLAELQEPRDSIALPDDMVIRNDILYVTSAGDKSVRAYKLQSNGFLPGEEDSSTDSEEYYSDILLDGDILYAAAYNAGRIDLYTIDPDGMLPKNGPILKTNDDPASYPAQMLMNGGILYVAQAGLDRIDAYVLGGDGLPSDYPTSSTRPVPGTSYPLGIAIYSLD